MKSQCSEGRKRKIGFRADGGQALGLGHLMRCLVLAETLKTMHDYGVVFYMRRDATGVDIVRAGAWSVVELTGDDPACIPRGDDALIVDLPGGVPAQFVRALRAGDPQRIIILFDGMCCGRLEADLVVSPIERLADRADWAGFRGLRFESPAYAILNPVFARLPKRDRVEKDGVPRLLVTMGGSDPFGLTLKVLRALDELDDPFATTVAVGAAFAGEAELQAWLSATRRHYTLRRESNLAGLMAASTLAVASFGTTVYELAAAGLPAVTLAISDDHSRAADIFARSGSLINLGLYSAVSPQQIGETVRWLLGDHSRLERMARAGQSVVDGRGAERVAAIIGEASSNRRQ